MTRTKNAWINGIFLVVTLIINTFGATGLFNGNSQKQVSDMFDSLITPIAATFSIWSVIYLLLIASMVVMIVKKNDTYYQKAVDEISFLFRISCILNALWIIAFSFVLIELSALFIIGFVVVLSLLCLKLTKIHDGKNILLPLTFGLYTGWLFIATVVNISVMFVKFGWDGYGTGNQIWAALTLIIGVALIFIVVNSNKNAVIPLPVAWAYFGIYRSLKALEGTQGSVGFLQAVAILGMVVLIGLAAIQLYKNEFAVLPKKAYK